jgi:hypothetical protein
MADLEDAVPLEGTPDLSDLALVIMNAETSEGRQLSFAMYPDGMEKCSMTYTDAEYNREEIMGDGKVIRVIPRRWVHTFTVTIEEEL